MTTSVNASWRRLAVLPLVLLVAGAGVLNAAGWLIDSSSLDQGEDSWGYAFGALFLTLYAAPVLVVAVCSALVGWLASRPGAAKVCAWLGAVICGAAAVGLLAVAFASIPGLPAEVAFGVASSVTGVLLVVPAGLCAWLTLRQRASAAAS